MEKRAENIKKSILIFLLISVTFLSINSSYALNFNLEPQKNVFELQENLTFFAEINIGSSERVPVNRITITIDGKECTFDRDGDKVTGCSNFYITQTEDSPYTEGNLSFDFNSTYNTFPEGFGYEEGNLKYTIIINSDLIGGGNFDTKLGLRLTSVPDQVSFYENYFDEIIIVDPVLITNPNIDDSCIIMGESFVVGSEIEGSIDNVYLYYEINGESKEINLGNSGEGEYFHNFNKNNFDQFGLLKWRFFAKDISGNFSYGTLNENYVYPKTSLEIVANENEDLGENNWYIQRPDFALSNPNSSNIKYSWNGLQYNYNSSFGVENLPNNGNKTGGIHTLRYWSNLCNEAKQNQTFKFDFTDPLIIPIYPHENQIINTQNIKIEIKFDETYQSNSGINKSSIKIYLDDNLVNAVINGSGAVDAVASYNTNLSFGAHKIEVDVQDNSGRTQQKTWNFEVLNAPLNNFILNVNSPIANSGILINNRVDFNITTSKIVDKISYIDYPLSNKSKPRERVLCKNCNEYGFFKQKFKILNEGLNNISIIAVDKFGNKETKNLTVIIDTKKPFIKETYPLRGFSNGKFFISFFDENPNLTIYLKVFNNQSGTKQYPIDINSCKKNKYYECDLTPDLSNYNYEQTRFIFNVSDITGKYVLSREKLIELDLDSPNITFFNYSKQGRNKIRFIIEINEENFDQINYIDLSEIKQRERNLCGNLNDEGRCEITKTFADGEHNLTIIAYDKAGNKVNANAYFSVVPILGNE